MAQELPSSRSKAPDFEHWESPETHVRWERGLAIVAGMILVVLTFFFLLSVLPLSPQEEGEEIRGLQPTLPPATATTPAEAAQPTATPAASGAPPSDQRLTATSRAFPNVRTAPSLESRIVSNLKQGQKVDVVGRSPDNAWLQILNPENSRERYWVSADMLEVTGDVRTLPQVRPE